MSRSDLVFVSYSRRDSRIVKQLVQMARASGSKPWRDTEAIAPGQDWAAEIVRTINESERVLVFWCRHSRDSKEVRKEYEHATLIKKQVVPVLLDNSSLPYILRPFQAVDVRKLVWWSHEFARRLECLMLIVGVLLFFVGVARVLL